MGAVRGGDRRMRRTNSRDELPLSVAQPVVGPVDPPTEEPDVTNVGTVPYGRLSQAHHTASPLS
jgi:hypothetical protein